MFMVQAQQTESCQHPEAALTSSTHHQLQWPRSQQHRSLDLGTSAQCVFLHSSMNAYTLHLTLLPHSLAGLAVMHQQY